jgi:NADPH:quinone reductase-like Zn-dependent oxidoreductase
MTSLPATMRALRFSELGQPDVLEVAELPIPRPDPGEVLIRVRAAGVNPVDVGLVMMPLPFVTDLTLPAVPGWEVAGTVVMRGAGAARFAVGDDVFGVSRFPLIGRRSMGTFAGYAAVPEADLAVKPAGLPWDQAGALSLAGLTVLQSFDAVGGIRPGNRVLIEAAAGGVGHIAVQIAKAAGATVIGTASAPRHDYLKSIGVDEAIDYTTVPDVFAAAGPLDGALVSTTDDALVQAVAAVTPGGFVVSISPEVTEDVAAVADKRGIRHADVLIAANGADVSRLADLVTGHGLHATVAATYRLDRAIQAYEQVRSRRTVGKVVLTPS